MIHLALGVQEGMVKKNKFFGSAITNHALDKIDQLLLAELGQSVRMRLTMA